MRVDLFFTRFVPVALIEPVMRRFLACRSKQIIKLADGMSHLFVPSCGGQYGALQKATHYKLTCG